MCWQNSTESSPNTALVVVCVLISALWTLCWAVLSPQLLGRLVTVLLRVYLKKACVSVGTTPGAVCSVNCEKLMY